MAYIQRSHLLDEVNFCWIYDRTNVLLTSWGDELDVVNEEQMIARHIICQVIDKYQKVKRSKHRAHGHPNFYGAFPRVVVALFYSESSFLQKLF